MPKRFVAHLAAPTFALALVSAAPAQEVSVVPGEIPDGYLEGTWAIGGSEACGAATTEHFCFAADGTFSTRQTNQPTAVGFWHLVDDKLDLHMASSPASFHDQLQPFTGQYAY